MNINYELAEKIGATHYYKKVSDDGYILLDINSIHHIGDCESKTICIERFVSVSGNGAAEKISGCYTRIAWAIDNIKPIPPRPKVNVVYEKVTESIFDLKEEFERGELFTNVDSKNTFTIDDTEWLARALRSNAVYRRIEKPVDWRSELIRYIDKPKPYNNWYNENGVLHDEEVILEIFKNALLATGEL